MNEQTKGDLGLSTPQITLWQGGCLEEMLKITQCPDRSRWYSSKIGDTVPFLGDVGNEYKSIEDDGYINFVQYDDAVIVKT
jgi:hypothetical protein